MKKNNNNLSYWLSLPNGAIKNKNVINDLYNHSKSLNTFYKKGIDITSLYKFSPKELKAARLIGEIYVEEPRIIEGIKKNINSNDFICRLGVKAKLYHKAIKVLKVLAKFNVIENDFSFALKVKGEDNRYKSIEYSKVKKIIRYEANRYIYICYTPTDDTSNRSFFVGHWFNALSYDIIHEQLKRNYSDFEIYTMVDYQTPTDVVKAKGDFDILALVNNKVLMVECKFSKIGHHGYKGMIKEVIKKSNELKRVFDINRRTFDYIPMLVYSKAIVEKEFLDEAFGHTDFQCLDIGELRASISELVDKPIVKAPQIVPKVEVKLEAKPKRKRPQPIARKREKRIIPPDDVVNNRFRRTSNRRPPARRPQSVVAKSEPQHRVSFLQRLRKILSSIFS